MPNLITRSLHPALLFPGVKQVFGDKYADFKPQWSQIFAKVDATLATERAVESTGFALASRKTEGAPIEYQSDAQGYETNITPTVWALGFQVTREEVEDMQYKPLASKRAEKLASAMNTTIEMVHANILLNGFTTYMTGDGVPLFSNAHPTQAGLGSNLGTVATDLSEAALEDITKQIWAAKNSAGFPIALAPDALIVPNSSSFDAVRILESELRVNTNNNDLNATKAMGLFPRGVITSPYLLANQSAFYVTTSMQEGDGLVSYWRREMSLERDSDFDTENQKCKATARFAPSVIDWRAIWGNPGQ